jgi:hypothetical protein
MFAQSKPYPEMIELVTQLKVRYWLKIAVFNNEGCEQNAYRIRTFKPDADLFRLALDMSRRHPGRSSISTTRRCSSRLRKAWGFEAFFTRITDPRLRHWRCSDCSMTQESAMKPANPRILTINGGSSSIKFALFEAGDLLRRILEGGIERIGLPEATFEELMIARSVIRVLGLG